MAAQLLRHLCSDQEELTINYRNGFMRQEEDLKLGLYPLKKCHLLRRCKIYFGFKSVKARAAFCIRSEDRNDKRLFT